LYECLRTLQTLFASGAAYPPSFTLRLKGRSWKMPILGGEGRFKGEVRVLAPLR
jgi:hypothetical protein